MGSPPKLPPTLTARYRPQQILGAGGAGHVILAHDTQLGRPVAVKILSGRSVIASASRFLAEAQALSRLSHPNILAMYDYGVVDEVAYLVLEFAEGGTLDGVMRASRRPTEELRELAGKVLDALAHAHENGVIHRDLKPANVLLTKAGEPKLADFGLAKHSSSQVRTASGLLVGTPEFMAPEIFRGAKAEAPADFFAWGCLLFALEFGHPPFEGELTDIVKAACLGSLPEKGRRSPFRLVYQAALAVDPIHRSDPRHLRQLLEAHAPQNLPTQMQAALRPALAPTPRRPTADPDGSAATVAVHSQTAPAMPPPAPPAASRLRPLALGLVGLALLGGIGWATLGGGPPPPPPAPVRDPASVAGEWRERLEAFRARNAGAEAVTALHAAVYGEPQGGLETYDPEAQRYPGGERHQAVMYEARVGPITDHRPADMATPHLEALGPGAEALPLRAEFVADRPLLVRYMTDASQPFDERLALHHLVQPLEHIDAYVSAWGAKPPYGAGEVTGVLAPVKVAKVYAEGRHHYSIDDATDFPRPHVAEEPLGEKELTAGSHLLYHWALDPDRRMPFILQDIYRLSAMQRITMGLFKAFTLSIGSNINTHYENVAVRVTLPPEPQERFQSLRLEVQAANCIAPDALRISWNGLQTFFRPGPNDSRRWSYMITSQPEYDLTLDLPPETWRPGENQLVLRVVSVPGINHRQGMDVYEVRLEARAKEDP